MFSLKPGGIDANDLRQLDICKKGQILRVGYNRLSCNSKTEKLYECRQFGELMFLEHATATGEERTINQSGGFKSRCRVVETLGSGRSRD